MCAVYYGIVEGYSRARTVLSCRDYTLDIRGYIRYARRRQFSDKYRTRGVSPVERRTFERKTKVTKRIIIVPTGRV